MRFLPFRALLVLVVLPPVTYMLLLQGVESLLTARYEKLIGKYVPGDTQPLLQGRIALEDMLQTNIERLNTDDPLLSHGVLLSVVVKTTKGQRLYPPIFVEPQGQLTALNPLEVASRNFALLRDGLVVYLDVKINQNTLVANAILGVCLMMALAALGGLYRRGTRQLKAEEEARALETLQGREREEALRTSLASIRGDNAALLDQIAQVRSEMEQERNIATRTEEDLFDEMAQLEQQLQSYLEQQRQQDHLIADLENQLQRLNQASPQQTVPPNRRTTNWGRRFDRLYKDTIVTDYAIKGFGKLSEPLQIKAEEVIQQLNAEPDTVSVKRKLFQRKGRGTVLEVVFARKGRLYFRRNKNRQVEVLAIGTKSDQGRDLGFLDRLGADLEQPSQH